MKQIDVEPRFHIFLRGKDGKCAWTWNGLTCGLDRCEHPMPGGGISNPIKDDSGDSGRVQEIADAFEVPSNLVREQTLQVEGHKDDQGKTRWSAMPWEALEAMARVMTFGAMKYKKHNFRKGMDYSRLLDAAHRHLKAWEGGEELDPESGERHLAHAMCCIGMLLDLQLLDIGNDDRWGTDES